MISKFSILRLYAKFMNWMYIKCTTECEESNCDGRVSYFGEDFNGGGYHSLYRCDKCGKEYI